VNDTNPTTPTSDKGIWQRVKESPRTVSALIIILIVAAAIYAFSGNQNNSPTASTQPNPTQSASSGGEQTPSAMPTTSPSKQAMNTPAPAPQKTNSGYVVVAQRGDGLTRLARRAASQWLSENNPGYTVTNEHRVYIEDYIRKQLGRKSVAIGAQQTVSFDLISQAVAKAHNLTPRQLQHLHKYTLHARF